MSLFCNTYSFSSCIAGAYDFVEKPFKTDRLLVLIERAIDAARLRRENEELRLRAGGAVELVGASAAIGQIRQAIERVAPTGSRVLITGPAGAGKEVVARLIHTQSRRSEGPFVVLNCATMSNTWRCSSAWLSYVLLGVRRARGHHIAFDALELAVLEEHRDFALLQLARIGPLPPEHIIPAFGMETVGDQRRAQDEAHLILAHAELQLRYHFLGNEIALLDFHPVRLEVRRGQPDGTAGSEE